MKAVFVALLAGLFASAFVQPVAAADAGKFSEKILYTFGSLPDAENPFASVIDVNGTLYGTTGLGGTGHTGTVFSLDPNTGTETVLHSFCSACGDGNGPLAGLIDVKSKLYGTTEFGGNNFGTVFVVNPKTGVEKELYAFCFQPNCTDGAYPVAGMIAVNGTLYGTTYAGGRNDSGTLFALNPNTGAETVLYSFCSQPACADGNAPEANLIDVNGILYGTTIGTVFSFDPNTGAEKVLYTFCSLDNCADGTGANGLIDVNGTLYGTTLQGGAQKKGTVFALDPNTGVETVLYSFCSKKNCTDGGSPRAGVIDVGGVLYGTAAGGGCSNARCGTAFSLDPNTRKYTVLHTFCSLPDCADGAASSASLLAVNGKLYGTASDGGANGVGTVFVLEKGH